MAARDEAAKNDALAGLLTDSGRRLAGRGRGEAPCRSTAGGECGGQSHVRVMTCSQQAD